MNFNSANAFAIAQDQFNQHIEAQSALIAPEPKRQITQRKARYHDRNRIRLRDAKAWVYRRTGLSTTPEVKYYLSKLGIHRDFRLVAAWVDTNINWCEEIAALVKTELTSRIAAITTSIIKVGNLVEPIEYTARTIHWQIWSPFQVMDVIGTEAKLDMVEKLIPLSQLQLVS